MISFRLTFVGLLKDHAVAASRHDATLFADVVVHHVHGLNSCRDWFVHESHRSPVPGTTRTNCFRRCTVSHRCASAGCWAPTRDASTLSTSSHTWRSWLPVQPAPLPRSWPAVLPTAAVRRRRGAADLQAGRGQPGAQGGQAARRARATFTTRQPHPAAAGPALARGDESRLDQRATWVSGSEIDKRSRG